MFLTRKKNRTSILIIVMLLGVGIILLKGLSILNTSFRSASVELNTREKKSALINTPMPSLSPYSVKILSSIKINNNIESPKIEMKISNNTIRPYITNVGIDTCTFFDEAGKEYEGKLFNAENVLERAILPGTSQDVSINNGSVELTGYGKKLDGFEKCGYQKDGSKGCSYIAPTLSIKECLIVITSNGKQSSNGWGEDPIKVEFFNK